MTQFQQRPIIEEGIEELVSEQEKRERIRKALEIHMLQNRESHMTPPGQTVFSFTQGEPGAVIGKVHGFGEALGAQEEMPKKMSIEEQQRQQQQFQTAEQKAQPMPIRTCPCCVRFLQSTFHMSEQQAQTFTGGPESGPVTYGSSAGGESYGMTGPSGQYSSGGAGGTGYSSGDGSGGAGYKPSEPEPTKYAGQKLGYE